MDGQSFDQVTRILSSNDSRRNVIKTFGFGALAVAFGRRGPVVTAAAGCTKVGKKCKKGAQCCSGVCKKGKCRAHDGGICPTGQDVCVLDDPIFCEAAGTSCACQVTTGNAPFCAELSRQPPVSCVRDADCVDDFGPGAACVVDCLRGGGTCAAACPDPAS